MFAKLLIVCTIAVATLDAAQLSPSLSKLIDEAGLKHKPEFYTVKAQLEKDYGLDAVNRECYDHRIGDDEEADVFQDSIESVAKKLVVSLLRYNSMFLILF